MIKYKDTNYFWHIFLHFDHGAVNPVWMIYAL